MFDIDFSNRLFLLTPVFCLCLYLGLILPPYLSIWLYGIVALGVIGMLLSFRRHVGIFWICFALVSGLLYGDISQNKNYKPIPNIIYKAHITGTIVDIDDHSMKPRITLTQLNHHSENSPLKLQDYIRLNISHDDYSQLNYGDTLDADVFLAPPARALFKGDYDFYDYARSHNLRATGRLSYIHKIQKADSYSFRAMLHTFRQHINQIMIKHLPQETAGPAVAMITGTRFFVPDTISESWRISGLYHLLSISGLHMTVMAGLIFGFIRLCLMCIPAMMHGVWITTVSALVTIPLCWIYVLIAGGASPVMRAFIMVAVGLIALIIKQRVITLRTACVAVLVILCLEPTSFHDIGFLLSFSAVLGIIIGINLISFLKTKQRYNKFIGFMIINAFAGYSGILLALYVFGNSYVYSFITNMIALPVTSFMVMPAIFITMLTIPAGLAEYPIMFLGYSITLLNMLSDKIGDLPHAVQTYQPPEFWIVMLFYTGVYAVAVRKQWVTQAGLVMMVISIVAYVATPKRDFLKLTESEEIFSSTSKNNLIHLISDETQFKPLNSYTQEAVLRYFGLPKHTHITTYLCESTKEYRKLCKN